MKSKTEVLVCKKCTENTEFTLQNQKLETYREYKVEGRNWTKESFTNTEIEDYMKCEDENITFFCDKEKKRRTKIEKAYLNRYAELAKGAEIACGNNYYRIIKQRTTFYNKEMEEETKEKVITAVFFDPTKQDGRSKEDVFNTMKHMKQLWLATK